LGWAACGLGRRGGGLLRPGEVYYSLFSFFIFILYFEFKFSVLFYFAGLAYLVQTKISPRYSKDFSGVLGDF
jgi:hypothetical protein